MEAIRKSLATPEDETDPFEEYECEEEEDYKEPQPEELSLLGNSLRQLSVGSGGHRSSTAPPDRPSSQLDIQIATTETEQKKHSSDFSSCDPKALCGPSPSRITLICILILSIWVMAILLVHLDKKLATSSAKLEDTKEKIQSLEDSAAIFRLQSKQKLTDIEKKLGRLLHKVKSPSSIPSSTSKPVTEEDDWGNWD